MGKNQEKERFNEKVMQANFSAILYLLTEQQALIGRLLQALLATGIINEGGLDKITDITDGEDGLNPTYARLYSRFAKYYLRTKQLLDDRERVEDLIEKASTPEEKSSILETLLDMAKIPKDTDHE